MMTWLLFTYAVGAEWPRLMASVTISKTRLTNLKRKLKGLKQPGDKLTATRVGNAVVREIRKEVAKERSPIRGKGKFKALQEPYKTRKGRLGKGKRPNLKLSGKFLRSLKNKPRKVKAGWNAVVGYFNKLSRNKEKGHREMANGQHHRPTIPVGNEVFNKRITTIIFAIYLKRIKQLIRKKQ